VATDKDSLKDDRLTWEVYEKTASVVSTAQWSDSSLLARGSNFWFPQGCLGMRWNRFQNVHGRSTTWHHVAI